MKRHILMLEHDEDDRYITQAILDELKSNVEISFISNSNDLFKQLQGPKMPDLVLITFRSFPLNAIEVLKKLRADSVTQHLPVVVLSGTSNATIVRDCYQAGASSFVTKPSTESESTSKIKSFLEYWFKTVDLP